MNHRLPIRNSLNLKSQPALSRRPSTHNILDDVELAVFPGGKWEPRRRFGEQPSFGLCGWVGIPVIWLLGASDDGAAVEGSGNTKGQGAVYVLFGEGY